MVSFVELAPRHGSILPLLPWISSFKELPVSDPAKGGQEGSTSVASEKVARDGAPHSKASRTARPRVPLFAWERTAPSPKHLMDDESRRKRIEKAFKLAHWKTLIMRAWIVLLFIFFNVYSFYLAAGDLYNTVIMFHPSLATLREQGQPKQLAAGAYTYAGAGSQKDLYAECFLVMTIALLTKLVIYATMVPFMIICMHWKAEPTLHLEDLMPDSKDWPTVDIFLPRYKEAWESFEPTIRATLASPASEYTGKDALQLPVPRPRAMGRAQFSFTARRAGLVQGAPTFTRTSPGNRLSPVASNSVSPSDSSRPSPSGNSVSLFGSRRPSPSGSSRLSPFGSHRLLFTSRKPLPVGSSRPSPCGSEKPSIQPASCPLPPSIVPRPTRGSSFQFDSPQILQATSIPAVLAAPQPSKHSIVSTPAADHSTFVETFSSSQADGSLPDMVGHGKLQSISGAFACSQRSSNQHSIPLHSFETNPIPVRGPPCPLAPPQYSFMIDTSGILSFKSQFGGSYDMESAAFSWGEVHSLEHTSPRSGQQAASFFQSFAPASAERNTERSSPKAGTRPSSLPQVEEGQEAFHEAFGAVGSASSQELPPMPDYPAPGVPPSKLIVYICDDGSRDPRTSIKNHVSKLVSSLPPGMPKVHYITRENGHHAKAGNLNNALKHANGDLVVVLDSDHIASPGFLLDLVPHMLCQKKQTEDVEKGKHNASSWTLEGSRVGMIQSKQYFYNEHEFVPYICGADNKIYYYLFQHGLNGLGAANCVGTGYVVNRKALDEIGGYVGGWAVEDSFTSTTMLKAGWQTKYTPDCEAIGLAPPTLSEHVQQRWRWSVGSAQLMLYGDYTSKLSFLQSMGIVAGNWYPISLSLVFSIILLRLACFVAYVFVAGPTGTTATQVSVSWLALVILLAMPQVGIVGKVFDVIGMYILQCVNLTVTFHALIGRLDPAKKKVPKIKAASEAQGDLKLPPMVIIMTIIVVVIILASLLIQLVAPDNSNVKLGFALSVSILFMLVLVAVPVLIIYLHGTLREMKRWIRRVLLSRAMKAVSPYPPVYFTKPKPRTHEDAEFDVSGADRDSEVGFLKVGK